MTAYLALLVAFEFSSFCFLSTRVHFAISFPLISIWSPSPPPGGQKSNDKTKNTVRALMTFLFLSCYWFPQASLLSSHA